MPDIIIQTLNTTAHAAQQLKRPVLFAFVLIKTQILWWIIYTESRVREMLFFIAFPWHDLTCVNIYLCTLPHSHRKCKYNKQYILSRGEKNIYI